MNLASLLSLERQRALLAKTPRLRIALLLLGICGIVIWQMGFVQHEQALDRSYRNRAAGGQDWGRQLIFYYYTGLFPVNTTQPVIPSNKEEIWKLIREKPETIYTWSNIERLSIYFHYVDALIRGNPYSGNFKITTASAFIFALIVLWIACWLARLEILGLMLVALLGSNPYQLYETYTDPNIFGWPILIGVFVLALWVPLLASPAAKGRLPWAVIVLSGLVAGTARHIRPEGAAIFVSAFLFCFFIPGFSKTKKMIAALCCAAALFAAMNGWSAFFAHQHRVTNRTLDAYGVKTDRGSVRVHYHPHWQGFLCGLGDFDTKYGYLWDDRVSYAVANAYGLPFNESCKKKIFGDIARDPLWYGGILARRAWRILTENTPARISWNARHLNLPIPGVAVPFLFALLVLLSVRSRRYLLLQIVLFSAPMAMAPFLMFSGYGESYFSVAHLFIIGVSLAVAAECLFALVPRKTS